MAGIRGQGVPIWIYLPLCPPYSGCHGQCISYHRYCSKKRYYAPGCDGALRLEAWQALLPQDDPYRDFLLNGIENGFKVTDVPHTGPPIWLDNYSSATAPQFRQAIERQINEELLNGRYVCASHRPKIISPLGAIPKRDSNKPRLIHDCSRPRHGALNDLAMKETFQYQSIQDAVDLITPHSWMAKCDCAAAYRYLKLHPSDHEVAGLAWTFTGDTEPTVMIDTRQMFGSRKSPYNFHQVSQGVIRIMKSLGFTSVVCYLDDFLVVEQSQEQCMATLNFLIKLLRTLGLAINYSKVEGPVRVINFLGLELSAPDRTIRLPQAKLTAFLDEVRSTLCAKSITKKQLQSLIGKLSWACQAIHGARPHLRRLIDRVQVLHSPRHRTRITADMRADLTWWIAFSRHFNGIVPMLENRLHLSACIDACSSAAGGVFQGEFYHLQWDSWPGTTDLHINYKEVLALEPALMTWGLRWANHRLHLHSDNQAAVAIINKGSCHEPRVMSSLRRIAWLTAVFNISIVAHYYPGVSNRMADAASRLPSPAAWATLLAPVSSQPLPLQHGFTLGSPPKGGVQLSVPMLGPSYQEVLQRSQEFLSTILSEVPSLSSASLYKHAVPICSPLGPSPEIFISETVLKHCAFITSGMGSDEPHGEQLPPSIHTPWHSPCPGRRSGSQGTSDPCHATPVPDILGFNFPPPYSILGNSPYSVFLPIAQEQRPPSVLDVIRPLQTPPPPGHLLYPQRSPIVHQVVQDEPVPRSHADYPPTSYVGSPPLPITGHLFSSPANDGSSSYWPCLRDTGGYPVDPYNLPSVHPNFPDSITRQVPPLTTRWPQLS